MPPDANTRTSLRPTPPNPIRIRNDDQMSDPIKLKACRRTIKIGETQYRCQLHHKDDLTKHVESGIIKRRGATDVRYTVEWAETTDNWAIR